MSKRFGRNQKRAMREMIAQQNKDLDFYRARWRQSREDLQSMTRYAATIVNKVEKVAKYSVALPPKIVHFDLPVDQVEFRVPDTKEPGEAHFEGSPGNEDFKINLLHRVRASLQMMATLKGDRPALHLYVGTKHHFAYFLTNGALRSGLADEEIVKEIMSCLGRARQKGDL